ncbi:MAG: AbrB/MazE/SpoVT family DNA-binding domain-containing protein [Promethearchaeota archaeon]|nr:MAG: AbrB/MazE/SpoVT family DNA-binding domain-containing protein [Candidatus Lokiarchaeota archaeon]
MPNHRHNHNSKNHIFFGSTTVGERGQITIPIEAREQFSINPGDKLLVFGDIEKGIGLIKASELNQFAERFFSSFQSKDGDDKK